MGTPIEIIDQIDNSGTLYEEVLSNLYSGDELNTILINTKFIRAYILKGIKEFIKSEEVVCIKEFSDAPLMDYSNSIPEMKTDLVIVKQAFDIETINEKIQNIDQKYPLVLEALDPDNLSKESWNDFLDEIHSTYNDTDSFADDRVHKIVIEDVISILKKYQDISNQDVKEMVKKYNSLYGIQEHDVNTFWQEPLYLISKNYWEKFSFVLTINDYEIYDDAYEEYLNVIADRYFDNGYFDEIVIKLNYFYWHDDFQKIVEWTEKKLKSALVSYRLDTIFNHQGKNRYYNEIEAAKYNDIQRQNTIEEELKMYEERIPVLIQQILKNPQTYGFELIGGYFGKEGHVPDMNLDNDKFEQYKEIICKILNISPLVENYDNFIKIIKKPENDVFICMKSLPD